MEKNRYPGLEISEDMQQQQREWQMQRIVWPLLYALLFAIALGLFGNGPLSSAEAGSKGGAIHLEYERFLRHRAPDKFSLAVQANSDSVELVLDKRYIRNIEIEKVTPTPEHVISGVDEIRFIFRSQPSSTLRAQFYFKPEKVGLLRGWIALKDQPRHAFTQFVYP